MWIDENNGAGSRDLLQIKMWFHQVVKAVAFLHHKNFIHRDLKVSFCVKSLEVNFLSPATFCFLTTIS